MKAITKTALIEKAKALEVKGLSKMNKTELIHAIQVAEGNAPCFQQIPDCAIEACLYRGECIP